MSINFRNKKIMIVVAHPDDELLGLDIRQLHVLDVLQIELRVWRRAA